PPLEFSPLPGLTPGKAANKSCQLRLMLGAVLTASEVNVVFFSDDSVCTSGASPETVTLSEVAPTSSVPFTVIVSTVKVMPERFRVLKASLAKVTLSSPTCTKGRSYTPDASVVTTWLTPVETFVMVTLTPGRTA